MNFLERCIYCGDTAEVREHFVPKSFVCNNFTLPACKECNALKSNKVFETVQDVKKFLREKIIKRYKNILNIPEWDKYNLDEIGPSLRSKIVMDLGKKRWIESRLKFLSV